MPPENSTNEELKAEKDLYQQWDRQLTDFFRKLEEAKPTEPSAQESEEQMNKMRSYRDRVGEDLKAFHEKLSDIMESEKSGQ